LSYKLFLQFEIFESIRKMYESTNPSSRASSSRYYHPDRDTENTFRNSRTSTNSTLSGTYTLSKKSSPNIIGHIPNKKNILRTSDQSSSNTQGSIKNKKVTIIGGSKLTLDKNLLVQLVDSEKLVWSFRQGMNRNVDKSSNSLSNEQLFKIIM
jgi:hypothetical protein